MAMELRGTEGIVMVGHRVASRLKEWELLQEDGDPAIMIESEGAEDHEVWAVMPPTEIRLRLGNRWITYRSVVRVSDSQWRAEATQ